MSVLEWDKVGERLYETGVDQTVLYLYDTEAKAYNKGYAWNGVTAINESPSGAETTSLYADNTKYLNLISAEEFGLTIEAYMSPKEFDECDGSAEIGTGVSVGQQSRKTFGLSYRSRIGNDVENDDYGYKLHLVYGCLASPSEKSLNTVNDSPEAATLSWEIKTTPVNVGGNFKPTSIITIDSTKADPTKLASFLEILHGTVAAEASLPMPADVMAHFAQS